MTFTELLKQEEEKLTEDLRRAASPEKARAVAADAWERLLYRWQEGQEEKKLIEEAVNMLRVAQADAGLLEHSGEAKVWQTAADREQKAKRKKQRGRMFAFLAVGLVLLILAVWVSSVFRPDAEGGTPWILSEIPLAMAAVSAVLLFLGGYSGRKTEKTSSAEQRVEITLDPAAVFRSMLHTAAVIDANLEQAAKDLAWEKRAGSGEDFGEELGADGIELLASLMEAACSRDGEYALEKAQDAAYFLHRRGIELVEDDGTRPELFDRLPSDRPGTIRPALVRDGKLLKKGLSGGGN